MSKHGDNTILSIGETGQHWSAVTGHLENGGWKVRTLVCDPDNKSAKALDAQGAKWVECHIVQLGRSICVSIGIRSALYSGNHTFHLRPSVYDATRLNLMPNT